MRLSNIVATSLLLAGFGTAHAQYRCDCTSVVDTCSAEVVARGTFLEIKTDQQMCARVDYFVDGQPFVSVVVDGEDREDWLARTTNPRILVQSCQVCRDSGSSPAPAAPRSRSAAGRGRPSCGGRRRRPRAADRRRSRISGGRSRARPARLGRSRVHGDSGRARSRARASSLPSRATCSTRAALAAVARRRYPADAERAPQVVKERIEFAPPRGAQAAPPPRQPAR